MLAIPTLLMSAGLVLATPDTVKSAPNPHRNAPGGALPTKSPHGHSPHGGVPSKYSPEVMAKFQELEDLRQKIQSIRNEALQTPALVKEAEELRQQIETHMRAQDPDIAEKMLRHAELSKQLDEYRSAGDTEKGRAIFSEFEELGLTLAQAQTTALGDDAIKAKMSSIEAGILAQMLVIEPKVNELLAQGKSLSEEVRSAMAPTTAPPPH